jgi:hypothetical protein
MIRADWRRHILTSLGQRLRPAEPGFCERKQTVWSEGQSTRPFESGGNHDQALRYLEIAYQGHTGWLLELQVNPAYDDLHSDARYQELIRRIGLPL